LRWYLMSSPILRGGDLRIANDGSGISDVVRLVINPIWNTFSFFCRYANVDGRRAEARADSQVLLDRYILAKTRSLVDVVTIRMDAYDIAGACNEIVAYLDALTNWYVRRSRDRFWGGADGTPGDTAAHDTLFTVLTTVLRLAAPLLPLLTEEMYGGLRDGASVHLADWPKVDELPADDDLVARMDQVRAVCSAALGLREDTGLRVRLPLASLTIAGEGADALDDLTDLIADELNVKSVLLAQDSSALGTQVLRPNSKLLGPKIGKQVQTVLAASKAGEWTANDDGTVTIAGVTLDPGEFELALQPTEGRAAAAVRMSDPEGGTIDLGLVVDLDTTVTPELEAEGVARDVIRQIQQARKDADLHVSDRIAVRIAAPGAVMAAVRAHESTVADAVLATSIELTGAEALSVAISVA